MLQRSQPAPKVPGMLPFVGGLLAYQRDPLLFLENTAKHGDVVQVTLLGMDSILLSHPREIEHVLRGQHRDFIKDRFTRVAKPLLGEGLLVSEGELWRQQRRLIAPSLVPQQLARYGQIMETRADLLLSRLESGRVLDIHAAVMRTTLEIVAECLFGAAVDDCVEIVDTALHELMLHYAHPLSLLDDWLLALPLPRTKRLKQSIQALDEVVLGFIRERREKPRESWDLLGALLAAQGEDGARMSDAQLRDEVLTLFLAGHETTALTLSYTMHLLAAHPETQAALVAELPSAPLGASESVKLPFLQAVLKESMRLYPPAWALGREARYHLTLDGYEIPKGSQLVIAPWVIHRDARFFPEPARFWPERWRDKARVDAIPRGAYLPFGDGPRVCVGNFFAMQEASVVLGRVLQRFQLLPAPEKKLSFLPSITLRPKEGVWLSLAPRAGAQH